jgi:thiamine pyrophosphokinase
MNLRHNIKKFTLFLNGKQINSEVQIVSYKIKSTNLKSIKDQTLYAADGGLNQILKNKISYQNIIWVGDYDSLNNAAKKHLDKHSLSNKNYTPKGPFIEEISLGKIKDFSDFALLLDNILYESKETQVFLEIFYGLGGRKDHEIANILEVERFISLLPKGGICYFHGGIIISSLDLEIRKANKINFSVFCKKNPCEVEITGGEYSGNFFLERPSHGLSNKAKESRVFFKTKNSIILIYF